MNESRSTPPEDRLEELTRRLSDETLSEIEWRELESLLLESRTAQARFVDLMALNAELARIHCDISGDDVAADAWLELPSLLDREARDADPEDAHVGLLPRVWTMVLEVANSSMTLSLTIAGLFVTTILLSLALIMMPKPEPTIAPQVSSADFVARVIRTESAVWSEATDIERGRQTDLWSGEPIELISGLVEIKFDSGAQVLLQGPAALVPLGNNRCRLVDGRLVATVRRASAYGFTVETPHAEVADLGTEFAIEVTNDNQTGLCVIEGDVEVQSAGSRSRIVGQGESLRIVRDASGQIAISEDGPSEHRFVRAFSIELVDWQPDAVIRPIWDTYTDKNAFDANFADQDEILIKHNDGKGPWEREGWIAFDWNGIPQEQIMDAQVVLHVSEGTRLDDAAIRGWKFELVALPLDEQATATDVTWESTREAKGRRVSTFVLDDPAAVGTTVRASGPELIEFLRSTDEEQFVLVIRRLTGNLRPNVVHGFVASEQGDLGPAIRLRYKQP